LEADLESLKTEREELKEKEELLNIVNMEKMNLLEDLDET